VTAGGSLSKPWRSRAWQQHLAYTVLAGRRMRYIDVGEGPAVILVHGLASTWSAWHRNILELATDHRVIAVDLPGFGRSDRLRGPVEIRHYADALRQLLDRLGVGRVRIVGHSMGGIVAQQFACRLPERSAALVLVACGGPAGRLQESFFRGLGYGSAVLNLGSPSAFGSVLGGAMAVAPLRRRLIGWVVHDPSVISRELAADMITTACRAPGTAAAVRASLRDMHQQNGGLIACPTLVVAGRWDRIVSLTSIGHVAAAIPGARYEIIPDAGHNPMFERPETFNALLRSFLGEFRAA
jgi:pimeloyl-ACP methyl ester carboxylesterase